MWIGSIRRFLGAEAGSTAVAFAMALPALLAIGGFATDYTSMSNSQNRLQQIVDAAALAVAREMTLAPMNDAKAGSIAVRYVEANLEANMPYKIATSTALVENNQAVRVHGQQQFATPFGIFEKFVGVTQLTAVAIARPTGVAEQIKLCVLALSETVSGSVNLRNGSRLTANGCMLQSNSNNRRAVTLGEGSTLKASTVCARGGIQNIGSSVEGNLVTDCPEIKDPLASKPEPKQDTLCKTAPSKINSGMMTLSPGTYCGGLQILGSAQVRLNPGVYVFRDGSLTVFQSAELVGEGVTLAFTGKNAYFRFEQNSLISLAAPTSGDTAGMLIWELKSADTPGSTASPINGNGVPNKITNQHRIDSDRAKVLTGTIYLKKGILTVDATKPVADQSPFTIFVVDRLDLFDGPNLVLNSNYGGTNVPVPAGVGPIMNPKVQIGR